MKTLLIIRHAKSDQSFWGNDFERPLNDRGKRDAPEMAKRVMVRNINPDVLVSSPALRAKKTAMLFAEAMKKDPEAIVYISSLYHAPSREFYEVIKLLNNAHHTVALFSHNPGITYFVNELVNDVTIDDMPTCGIFAIGVHANSWKDFAKAKKDFLFFDYPKNY
ncbi:MAG: histidine phosphatase family protein [Bacteroidetes bacterium]|nr:histidine phosphatase family protein [Bacteroidota bacterium]